MMSEFKKMKFLVNKGELDIYEQVCKALEGAGYDLRANITANKPVSGDMVIVTGLSGYASWDSRHREHFYHGLSDYEEINIDWMRTTKPETIELNGKTYIKTELEEALRHIKPVGEE